MERHPADIVSLIAGAVFIVLGGLFLANRFDVLGQAHWIVPVLLIAVALALLASASWSLRRATGLDDTDG